MLKDALPGVSGKHCRPLHIKVTEIKPLPLRFGLTVTHKASLHMKDFYGSQQMI